MKITKFYVENLAKACVTDNFNPRFSFAIESEKSEVVIKSAKISVGNWAVETDEQINVVYDGEPLKPFTEYVADLAVTDNYGESDSASLIFETGRLGEPWQAYWITDGTYKFTEKGVSPTPMTFRKELSVNKPVKSAKIYVTAMGIYELFINGKQVGKDYFAPGFTSYKTNLQYQVYDIKDCLEENSVLDAVVAGGWAVGSFVFTRKNRVTADRQALLAEIRIEYADGSFEVIGTDESWRVTRCGNFVEADFYDGETYDSTVDLSEAKFVNATKEKLRVNPKIIASYGDLVTAHEVMTPVSVVKNGDELIYDFGQNFAGVICAEIKGEKGQTVIFRHAEVLDSNGQLLTKLLRSAKATAKYICSDGEQVYSPRLTYMGFRYVGVSGIAEENIKLSAFALYSDIKNTGAFECSNELINKLQQNIVWSAKSNFVDIPTDCPQRDERMGWTGDIAVFAPTACYNFDMYRFLEKWLKDVRAEQLRTGGLPNTVPVQGYGFPATMPKKAIAFWGDAAVFVPWAMYLAGGDKKVLEVNYEMMKKYVKAEKFWANIGFGKHRYIWSDIPMMQFGDWIAPDVKTMGEWQARCKWTGTGAIAASSLIMSKVAKLLGKEKDEKFFEKLHEKVSDAYVSILTDGEGKLKNEFQTAYVLPIYFEIFKDEMKKKAAKNLAELVKNNDYCIGTGFPGTPYILFALADNGEEETAFKMLTNTKCPSWLYEVKVGGTTIWEHWDAIREDGSINGGEEDGTGGMSSYNHYASGAVGDFLYKRVLGIEATSGGYKTFRFKPVIGGGITCAKGFVETPYGKIGGDWKLDGEKLTMNIAVPVGAQCEVIMPSGKACSVGSGKYTFEDKI
ncbi:MAG: family 78 glycoside hydrolase catalytic domain [Clostridia bacterium]|nr:family 78 glycoside hydrolase catalytic domain [Clostridia bacterium]